MDMAAHMEIYTDVQQRRKNMFFACYKNNFDNPRVQEKEIFIEP